MELTPGFKQTDMGPIPEDWRSSPLAELLKEHPTYGINAPASDLDPTLPAYLRITDIQADGRLSNVGRVSVNHPSWKQYVLNHNDIVVARTGASVGKSYIYDIVDGELVFAGFLIKLSVNGVRLNPRFLFYYMQTSSYWKWVELMSMRSGQPGINGQEYATLLLPLPSQNEQQAIAEVLGDVDALLDAQDRQIAKARNVKHATMQALLSGSTRLPGFSEPWPIVKLASVVDFQVGRTPSRRVSHYWGKGHPWLTISDFGTKRIAQSAEQITDDGTRGMSLVPAGTLMMSFKLSIGKVAFAGVDLYTNEAICSFMNPRASPEFLYQKLQMLDLSVFGKRAVMGFTLNNESLREIELPLPTFPEQEAIAEVLSEMDAEIDALVAVRDKTAALKTGLMQQLLTGRTRLPGFGPTA